MDSTVVRRCADEGEACTCSGTVYYGRAGVPFSAMLNDPYASLSTQRRCTACGVRASRVSACARV